jgi:DNA-binding LytR/AlgR family response regulator
MRARIEKTGPDQPEEVIIRCKDVTPEIEAIARLINEGKPINGKQAGESARRRTIPTFFKDDRQFYLSLREILFFETDADRVFAHTAQDAFETKARLYELESMLPGSFVRVSKSSIVNIRHVLSIQKGLTRVSLITFRRSHKTIYCSRQYSHQLIDKMEARNYYENE